jgi:hypothetical protein
MSSRTFRPCYIRKELHDHKGIIYTKRPTLVFFLAPTKPLQSYEFAIPHRDTVLVRSRDMTGRSQTLPWWLGEEEQRRPKTKYTGPIAHEQIELYFCLIRKILMWTGSTWREWQLCIRYYMFLLGNIENIYQFKRAQHCSCQFTTPFSLVLRRNILTVHWETLTQYITCKRGGERGVCPLVLCSLELSRLS